MTPAVSALGDSALLIELEPVIAAAVNAHALAIADAINAKAFPGIRDVVPAFASVVVHFDPLRTRLDALEIAIADCVAGVEPPVFPAGRVVDVPCWYGADSGPDLAGVAAWAGCSEFDVIRLHSAPVYRVCMLGFLPGFPYLADVDERIGAPRHPTPRVRVAAGSVGIAARQTGIYPRESPGGWQIIGRTPIRLFDPDRTPPAALSPGDHVRFVPISASEFATWREPDGARP